MAFLMVPSTQTPPADYPPADPAINYTFPLDVWQQQAVTAIHRGINILVTAKTGSGKTLVGEYQIAYSLKQQKRIFYTTPIKSLSNQKFHDLKKLFPEASVGILTGDIKFNPEADIIVMTTEILRNLLFKANTATAKLGTAGTITMDNLGAVIFDEVHYINDPERGHVWEETLILLPPQVRLILLSATIDSPEIFANWLGNAKQHPIVLLKTTHRIVPLIHGVYDSNTSYTLPPITVLKTGDEALFQPQPYQAWLKAREERIKDKDKWVEHVKAAHKIGESIAGSVDKIKIKSFTHTLNEALDILRHRNLLPALFFVFSRKETERYADQLKDTLLDTTEQASVKHIISFHLHPYIKTLEHLPQYHQLLPLLQRGIAFHHSGLLPLLKEIVEILFARGFIKTLFCTETFAVGLNMPARTVVFLDLKKPGNTGQGFRPLRSDEYIQMAGRAGRRGKDTQGTVIYLPARDPMPLDELRTIFSGRLVPLESRLQFHYDFLLKAIHASQNTQDTQDTSAPIWTTLIDQSYWTQQQQTAKQAIEEEIRILQMKQSELFLTADILVELNAYATLEHTAKTATNAAKRKAQQALEQWKDRHMGPKWASYIKLHIIYQKHQATIDQLLATKAQMDTSVQATRIDPLLKALQHHGAIYPLLENQHPKLTEFGTAATEVNEANPLLLAKLYLSGKLATATLQEIVGTLGAFIMDREAEAKTVHPRSLPNNITQLVKDTLMTIDGWGVEGNAIDKKAGVESPDGYWSLTTLWVQIGTEWCEGVDAAHLSSKYEIYEGNLMKGLLKLNSIVQEWVTIATLRADVDMLNIMKDAQTTILRDIAQPESLYLRL
jgi:superfamily II RNA helicase